MKKIISVALMFSMLFLLTVCTNSSVSSTRLDTKEQKGKTLVAYFSCTGTTKSVAQNIASLLNVDLFEIIPSQPYTEEDLAYYTNNRADKEQNNPNARPSIARTIENMEQYDKIILGYPIWHGQAPRIISTFLETYDFTGKTIIPFCTSGGSGIGASDKNLQAICQGSAIWKEGNSFNKQTTNEELKNWLDNILKTSPKRIFNLETKTVQLSSGYEMPINGIGTYSLLDDVCVNSVTSALNQGVRLIDTASIYHNEEAVGRAIKNSNVPREGIFITTKLYPDQYINADKAIDEALQKLDVEYIDLMLLHHPGEYDIEVYRAMEKAVDDGKIRSIGLSNWYIEELQDFLPQITITPAVVQNEIHPYYQESDVIEYIQSLGIIVEGWYPLGGRGHTKELLENEVILNIAKAHNVSSAQVILRWNLQKGVVVIPGSSNPAHIKENTELYHFELSEEEMKQINALNRDEKHDWY